MTASEPADAAARAATVAALRAELGRRWDPGEYPCVTAQIDAPDPALDGLRVVAGFPVFANTMTLFTALLAAGVDLVVSPQPGLPHDPEVVADLPGRGVPVVTDAAALTSADVVLDCAGGLHTVPAAHGYVELTRSGEDAYAGCDRPVFWVDAGRVKHIENMFGTGDGFVRAMAALGHPVGRGDRIVVVGGGKVGQGITRRCLVEGADVTIVDRHAADLELDLPVPVLAADDRTSVGAAFDDAWCVVTATGRPAALADWADRLASGGALLTNMGAEDEYGPGVTAERALFAKRPLNFVLPEPTRLRYLDPSLALAVAGAAAVARGGLPGGLVVPDRDLERRVLAPALAHGKLGAEWGPQVATVVA